MKKYIETMAKFQKTLGAVLLFACLVFISLEILSGYVGFAFPRAKEMAVNAMIWGVFVESGELVYEKSHFAFTVFSRRIRSEKAAAVWDIFVSAVKMLFSLLLIYYGFKLSTEAGSGTKAEFLNEGFLWLCLPFCGFTSMIYLFWHAACDVACLKKGGRL